VCYVRFGTALSPILSREMVDKGKRPMDANARFDAQRNQQQRLGEQALQGQPESTRNEFVLVEEPAAIEKTVRTAVNEFAGQRKD
jgi:hypothetical protein